MRRTAVLRDRFGPEYDRTVENRDSRRAAEADLRARQKRRAQFEVKPLPEAARLRFADEWRDVQERFVDQPSQATTAADALITDVMEARGYPMQDFDAQADLISVDHPDTVENYRFAHAVRQRSQTKQATTEDLRDALLRYRSLFAELLQPEGDGAADPAASQAHPAGTSGQQRAHAGPEPRGEADDSAEHADGPAVESDSASPAALDPGNHDQQVGGRGGR